MPAAVVVMPRVMENCKVEWVSHERASRYQQTYAEFGTQLSCGKTNRGCDGCCVKARTGNLVESEAHEAFARVPQHSCPGSYLALGNFRPPLTWNHRRAHDPIIRLACCACAIARICTLGFSSGYCMGFTSVCQLF